MAKLAIRGHETRGKEVIEILEMLGGKTSYDCDYKDGFASSYFFFIDENFYIDGFAYNSEELKNCYIITLEEFLENFPYKVGDKVLINDDKNDVYTVKSMEWNECFNRVVYRIEAVDEIMDDHNWFAHEMHAAVSFNTKKEETVEEKLEQITLDIPDGYEFFCINDNNKVVLTKKQPQYPTTYEECCEVLFPNSIELGKVLTSGYNCEKLKKFGELLICRDAYWKIAGEQMGLGKPWDPDWLDTNTQKYCIYYVDNEIKKQPILEVRHFLAFPTAEMRDAFYENFKDLIEQCKEFL